MDENAVLLGLMDALLPGGNGIPSASAAGIGLALASRLRQVNTDLLHHITAFVNARQGSTWSEIAAQLEVKEKDSFDELRKYTYLTYYEQESVVTAIRALGFTYNDSPLPNGYAGEPFSMSRDAPHHERGHWIETTEVHRVNVEELAWRKIHEQA